MTSLKNTLTLLSNLKKKLQPAMFKAGNKLISNITTNWKRGKGADGVMFTPLTPGYRKRKISGYKSKSGKTQIPATGRGRADMHLTGHMQQAFDAFPIGKYRVKVGFNGIDQIRKATGNAKARPNMLKVTKNHANYISNLVLKEIFP